MRTERSGDAAVKDRTLHYQFHNPNPAAAAADAPGELAVAYGLELDEGLPIPSLREAAPVARLVYTVSLPLQP